MLLSSNVIKKVSHELENCSVYPRVKIAGEGQDITPDTTPELKLVNPEPPRSEAELVLEDAQNKAESLLHQAREKIVVLEKEAYAQGYQQGEQEAQTSWEKAWADFHTTTTDILNELEKLRADIYRETEAELIGLAVKMAEKLVCRQLDINPDTIIDIIKSACDQARDCKEVVLYVPARQLESIIAKQGEIDARLFKTEHFAIRSDPHMDYCGCRIETEQGYIDASLETMAGQLSKLFKEDSQ